MVRDDLFITVPSLFRCPISLDVMKSPVSLCTGVTYDRTSIQRWLDNGNNTCPLTMQVLRSKEVVPNRNLQRLIKTWSDSVQHHRTHRVDSATTSVPSQDEIKCIVKDIETEKDPDRCCFDALSKILCFAEESVENREFLAKMDGFVQMLVDFLGDNKSIDFIEQVIRVLELILIKMGDYKQLMTLLLKNKNVDACPRSFSRFNEEEAWTRELDREVAAFSLLLTGFTVVPALVVKTGELLVFWGVSISV
ncbi:hypothetical protein GH714_021260 [Hevea brasiliensis]|uniref:U-box domain-containing protein n=1 Tax=Hevea brasiliensis TaxID=3981 RepID=A0A6A6K8E4_HEVBR|nr:hypothetical protein GH714_021260 [Hevea brasiliensis]